MIGVEPHHRAIARSGFEHVRPPAGAACLHVDDRADMGSERMTAEEGFGPVEADFLTVGEEQDQVALRRPTRANRAGDLQRGGDPDRVVGGARRSPDAVMMGHQQDRRPVAILAGDHADQIMGDDPRLLAPAPLAEPAERCSG